MLCLSYLFLLCLFLPLHNNLPKTFPTPKRRKTQKEKKPKKIGLIEIRTRVFTTADQPRTSRLVSMAEGGREGGSSSSFQQPSELFRVSAGVTRSAVVIFYH
ncbi:hypothetical protein P280DRAFT_118177 [Massarina eburnea CBS 473.64]|uniref:Secreted protein n=1 Tax=Massarina eburnea CBS 473.64 TaxID=1395130 RepID=A0A6A6SC77_9PLEO|nr:hypothetical protein P280DRAFT_118177 [Massarina eburnea CBS 473.64]